VGGLARRATFIKAARAENANLLLLDGGNTFWSRVSVTVQSQGKVIVEAMNLMGYDAVALGETDLQLGEDILRQRIADAQFAVLSANVIVQSTGELFADPYVLLEVGGRTVGIIGVTGSESLLPASLGPEPPLDRLVSLQGDKPQPAPAPSPLSGPSSPTPVQVADQPRPAAGHIVGSLAIIDPAVALAAYVKELQAQTNVIIVLSNLGWESNVRLTEMVPGVDLIISAGAGKVVTDPWQAPQTGTLVCQAGVYPQANPGQLVANIKMHIDSAGLVTEYTGGLVVLGPQFADDAGVRRLLLSYLPQ